MSSRINKETTAEYYLEQAEKMLEQQELLRFVENITTAKLLAGNDEALLARVTYLKVVGLFKFNQHRSCLENVEEALRYNKGKIALQLRKCLVSAMAF